MLDVGAANVGLAEWGKQTFGGFKSYTMMDISKPAIEQAKKSGYQGVLGDCTKDWPLPDNSFDVVLASHIIEHLQYQEAAHFLKEARRVLAPGGRIIVVTPSTAAWFFWSEWTHVRPHNHVSLHNMLRDNGYKDVVWDYPRSVLPLFVKRYLSKLPVHFSLREVSATGTR